MPYDEADPYSFRSTMGLSTALCFDLRQPPDLGIARRFVREWREVVHLFYGDFYPLTQPTTADDEWMAWQFHRHAEGDGLIQVFRRLRSANETGPGWLLARR